MITLEPHQQEGIDWLRGRAWRGLLWYCAGTGKSFTALGALKEADKWPALIFVPAILKKQFSDEITRFNPAWRVVVVTGTQPERAALWCQEADIFVCNYDLLSSDPDLLAMVKINPRAIVADECHVLANATSKRVKRFKKLNPEVRIAMSGDPSPNHLHELFSVTEWLGNTELGRSFYQFKMQHCIVHPTWHGILGYRDEERLRGIFQKFIHRVKKEDVLDIPEKTERLELVDLAGMEAYDTIRREMMVELQGIHITIPNVIALILRLRQFVDSRPEKLERLQEILAERDCRTIVFCDFKETLEHIKAQFPPETVASISGDMTPKQRESELARFKDVSGGCKLMIGTSALTYGLNLQVAERVINLSLPWNDARLKQRVARAWRYGQDKEVEEITVVAVNTIDQKIWKLIEKKRNHSSKFDRNDYVELMQPF